MTNTIKLLWGTLAVLAVAGCGSRIENVKLQAAPYTDNVGQYRVPLKGKLKIDMLPNEFILVSWFNLDIFHIDFEGKNLPYLESRKETNFRFELSPASDAFQTNLHRELELSDILDFTPVSVTLLKEEPTVEKIPGIASRIKMRVDKSKSLKNGVVVTELEIDFEQAFWRSLIAKYGPVTRQKDGTSRLSTTVKTPVSEDRKWVKAKAEIVMGEPRLVLPEGLSVDKADPSIVIPLSQTVSLDCYQDYLTQTIEENWPMRLKVITDTGNRVETDVKIERILVDVRQEERSIEGPVTVDYGVFLDRGTGFEKTPAQEGSITAEGENCILRLSDILDLGLTARRVHVRFTTDGSTAETVVDRPVFLKLAGQI